MEQYCKCPLLLESTRVWRTYSGGKKIEAWQGKEEPRDGEFPEEWVASVVNARNTGREHLTEEGLSKVLLDAGRTALLKELIESDPSGFLGEQHVQKYGNNTAVLVKVLDSCCRLSIQVHPDREFAKNFFNSPFGKTEAWYVLGGRTIDGEPPFLLFGFKPGVTKTQWQELFAKQDIQGMVDCLHRLPVEPGMMLLIEGGVPHAIGSGCFLVEIQEPTDYTIRVERTTPEGKTIPDQMCHQGLGFEKLFDCFHYDGYSLAETLQRWRIAPQPLRTGDGYQVTELIGPAATDKFSLHRLNVSGCLTCQGAGSFSVLIVLAGSGWIRYAGGVLEITQSDMVFLPAGLSEFTIEAKNGRELEIMHCFPPR